MNSPELLTISVLKALAEIAALSLLAQGVVGALSGEAKQENFVYRLFQVITAPIIKGVRAITPGFIADRYVGIAGFLLLFWLWVGLVFAKGYVCHAQNLVCIRG